ncbi:DNA repair protein RecO [Piscinibacter gummiphilus]|uniref:DNA repair protein RecO n=1 Tax=Piscinibacter gummiphilus TaxID=946333 RepID=A0ABZ0CWZ7_9BURK|nr:DNA repair protein RecO [Piscinibacter gummiphilus]WOB09482.1 DNA repair protein RecO [Piscinibacter gummiphilus]
MATRATRPATQLAAFVLHHYDWSESSLILDLFTREQGRQAVVAKGAKRPYSQMRAVLLPFQRLQVSLGKPPKAEAGEGAGEVQTLRAAEWAGGQAMLTGAALFSGFYLNELLMKLLARGDPHPALFDLYAQTLPALASADENDTQAALRAFEVLLLKAIGLLPDLGLVTLTQEDIRLDQHYAIRSEAGVTAPRAGDAALSGPQLIGLQAALEHGSLAALQQACAPALPELKAILRGLLHYHLGSPVLRTRQVMLDVQSLDRQLDR